MEEISKWYQILDLEPGASPEQVKQAYRDMVKVWHPDRFGSDQRLRKKAEEMQKEINLAFEQLEDYVPPPETETEAKNEEATTAASYTPARRSPLENPTPPIVKHKAAFQDTWDIRAPLGFRTQDRGRANSGDPSDAVSPDHRRRRAALVMVLAMVAALAIILLAAVILR